MESYFLLLYIFYISMYIFYLPCIPAIVLTLALPSSHSKRAPTMKCFLGSPEDPREVGLQSQGLL